MKYFKKLVGEKCYLSPLSIEDAELWAEWDNDLEVEPIEFVKVFSRLPGIFDQPHTSVHLLYLCEIKSGEIKISDESLDIGFFHIEEIETWHREHKEMAEIAQKHIEKHLG